MASFKFAQFGGVVPRYASTLLRENMASEAENVKLWRGTLAPFRMPEPVFNSEAPCVRTMYRFECCWLTWENCCVEVAEWLPDCKRVFVSGDADWLITARLPDGEDCTMEWLRVGLPVPTAAPTVTPVDATLPPLTTSSRIYLYAYVNSFGEIGVPSPPSNELLDMHLGAAANVVIPAPPPDWDIVAIRLFRVEEGFNAGVEAGAQTVSATLFVADLDPVAQTYTDSALPDELMEVNVSEQYTPPPDNIDNITMLPNGVLAGSVGNRVLFCEPYQPQAWPIDYEIHLDDNVCAMKWQNDLLYIMTDGHPYVIGEPPLPGELTVENGRLQTIGTNARYRPVYRFPRSLPIVSRKSAVQAPSGVLYASVNGLVHLSGKAMSIITAPWYSKDDWLALLPHTMAASVMDGHYIAFTCKSGFMFNIRDGIENDGMENIDLMPLTLTPNALHTARDGKLYLAFGNVVHEWDAGATFLPYRWRSKNTMTPGISTFGAAKVTFERYPAYQRAPFGVMFHYAADDRRLLSRLLKMSKPFRLPAGRKSMNFTVEVEGIEEVREIKVATSMAELAS